MEKGVATARIYKGPATLTLETCHQRLSQSRGEVDILHNGIDRVYDTYMPELSVPGYETQVEGDIRVDHPLYPLSTRRTTSSNLVLFETMIQYSVLTSWALQLLSDEVRHL